ncbi:hypothetical protein SAMN05216456_3193 [Devosia crocina]|uniref:YCII-related domain-containing protein n=1 Tax=Devosia crocina TaxID=429728 RepID=A0A1I7NTH7_9HYPH|nr:hypothetical protein [Devosia crocina]SFV37966.1 hypothetical protein SAMN05216456_3193 [Devosia crocina]
MPRFLAVYTMPPENLAQFRALPKEKQDAIDAVGVKLWGEWETQHSPSFADAGGMVGKTLRVSAQGTAPASNTICGYVVVRAGTIEEAAEIFRNHPHFALFPGDAVDIMPLVTGPPD